MEDKRITKTKMTVKATLIEMLQDMHFEKITVSEICRRSIVSRITFYTHYEDKYVLVEEIFSDYISEAYRNYHKLQDENNTEQDVMKGYINLLEAILCLFYDHYDFFAHATAGENPYLYSVYYSKVFEHVNDYLRRHTDVRSVYPTKQMAALLCNSMFAVINTCIADNMEEGDVRKMAHEIYLILLKSDLFEGRESII